MPKLSLMRTSLILRKALALEGGIGKQSKELL